MPTCRSCRSRCPRRHFLAAAAVAAAVAAAAMASLARRPRLGSPPAGLGRQHSEGGVRGECLHALLCCAPLHVAWDRRAAAAQGQQQLLPAPHVFGPPAGGGGEPAVIGMTAPCPGIVR